MEWLSGFKFICGHWPWPNPHRSGPMACWIEKLYRQSSKNPFFLTFTCFISSWPERIWLTRAKCCFGTDVPDSGDLVPRPNKDYRLQLAECDESDVYPVNNEFGVAREIRLGCPNTVVV